MQNVLNEPERFFSLNYKYQDGWPIMIKERESQSKDTGMPAVQLYCESQHSSTDLLLV